jgi:chromosome segregation ATPase
VENSTNSNNKIAAMNNQLSDLKVQLELKDKEVCDAEMKVVEFENKAGALETENALLEKDNTDLTQQSELQQIRYAELVKESISKEQVINTLNGKILTLNAEIESMRKVKPTEIVIPKETLASLMRRLFKLK